MFAAGAATAYAAVVHDRYGYSPVRNSISKGVAHFHVSSPDLADGGIFPAGNVVHHYAIRVLALDTAGLGLPGAGTSTAVSGFVLGRHIIGVAQMTVNAQQ